MRGQNISWLIMADFLTRRRASVNCFVISYYFCSFVLEVLKNAGWGGFEFKWKPKNWSYRLQADYKQCLVVRELKE